MSNDRRSTPHFGVVLALGAIVLASLIPAVRAPATPHMEVAARAPENLHEQVVRHFEQLDEVTQAIESVQAETAWVRERISVLSRQIEARQELLNRRAAEAYMGERAVGFDSVLGAGSFTDLQDSLEFLDAVSQQDHEVLVSLEERKQEIERQWVRLEALGEQLREKQERLEATAASLVERLRQQHARLRALPEESPSDVGSGDSSGPPSPPVPSVVPGRAAVIGLIREHFGSLGSKTEAVALCVAEAESNFNPLAESPSTGAAGVFQFLPSTWVNLSELAGLGGASVFDARANVAVTAWTVAEYGWHPWSSVAEACRV
ncbi:MAG TPA: transglycosylase SLT domain-containing protein [Actinomycetota bacterium]